MSDLVDAWVKAESEPFTGWDFGRIGDRYSEDQPPWSYEELARGALREARAAIDLGTGGGEVLATLRDSFPPLMVATEAWPPNQRVARDRLAPLGASVVAYAADESRAPLPFRDGSVDAVLDRHEAYDAREVARILAGGGRFLTQQVDGRSHTDLLAHFGTEPGWPEVTVERLAAEVGDAGLEVEVARSWWGTISFRDVGALVYYLKAIPWYVPDFTVRRFTPALMSLQRQLEREGELRFGEGRFVIGARKP